MKTELGDIWNSDIRRYLFHGEKNPEPEILTPKIKTFSHPLPLHSHGAISSEFREKYLWRYLQAYKQSSVSTRNDESVERFGRSLDVPYITRTAFNSRGSLLAATNNCGVCFVMSCNTQAFQGVILEKKYPGRLEDVAWNPLKDEQIGVAAYDATRIHCFDLLSESGESTREVIYAADEDDRCGSRRAPGISGMQFSAKHNRIIACAKSGKMLIWDPRKSKKVCALIEPANIGSLFCLELSGNDEEVLFAGSETGKIAAWDLRKTGSAGGAFSSSSMGQYSHLATLSTSYLFQQVPQLQEQAGDTRPSSVESMAIDPSNGIRLGFNLANGWSGALDLRSLKLTHGHCPPPPWANETEEWESVNLIDDRYRVRKRRSCWLNNHSVYVVPSAGLGGLHLLPFGSVNTSPFSFESRCNRSVRKDFSALLSGNPVCVAVQAESDTIAAGTLAGDVTLLCSQGEA